MPIGPTPTPAPGLPPLPEGEWGDLRGNTDLLLKFLKQLLGMGGETAPTPPPSQFAGNETTPPRPTRGDPRIFMPPTPAQRSQSRFDAQRGRGFNRDVSQFRTPPPTQQGKTLKKFGPIGEAPRQDFGERWKDFMQNAPTPNQTPPDLSQFFKKRKRPQRRFNQGQYGAKFNAPPKKDPMQGLKERMFKRKYTKPS